MDAGVVSVNVGRIGRFVDATGREIPTAFRKIPVAGPVRVLADHLEGDTVGDPTVHGGPRKAVYAYPTEHYEHWGPILRGPAEPLGWGSFGENLSTRGLREEELRAGDRLGVGTAVLIVTQPRRPCFKLGLRHDRPVLLKEFQESGRSGFYLGVERPGILAAGDPIVRIGPPGDGPTIAELFAARRERPS